MAKTFESPENKGQSKPTPEEIAKRAYELFERSGREPGQDVANWLAAEAQLVKENGRSSASTQSAAKPGYRETTRRQP